MTETTHPSAGERARTAPAVTGALPNLVVIGAMKAGTSALHEYLDGHPEIAMSRPKELNFFFAPEGEPADWCAGNHGRGVGWYASHFDARSPVRGESSPGYTSPAHPGVAARMAALLPDARLLYVVRDPVERAISQYLHHWREGTERRPMAEALLDPRSQYLARGRYHERLLPFLGHFGGQQIAIVAQEELLTRRRAVLRSVFGFLGVDETYWSDAFGQRWNHAVGDRPAADDRLRERLAEALRDDAERLREYAGRSFPDWSV